MDTTKKPKTMAELLPGLSGILSKDALLTLTAKKMPRPSKAATRTSEKVYKPMTIAEIKAHFQVPKVQTPRRFAQGATSVKKSWNSSVKVVEKTVGHTANAQMKHNPVRKALNFQQPKPKIPTVNTNTRMTVNEQTPKFPKDEIKSKKPLYLRADNVPRISGICNIPASPLLANNSKHRRTIANKENIIKKAVVNKKNTATPKSSLRKRIIESHIPDTPLSNESWKSSCDASFIQNEKDIEFIESKIKALTEETFDNIAEVSPPISTPYTEISHSNPIPFIRVSDPDPTPFTKASPPPGSTPFKEYRNVKELFNNSSDVMDNSTEAYHDNTIMCFDKTSINKDLEIEQKNSKREESVIVSLCDMLNKAVVSKTETNNTELDVLLEVEKQIENNLKIIETLKRIKESELKSLHRLRKMIAMKQKKCACESDKDKTIIATNKDISKTEVEKTPEKSPIVGKPCSVLKSCLKSPSYKIPKKNMSCMRKKVFYKSLPNLSNKTVVPQTDMSDKALCMYMKMKEHMNFLNTPVVKARPMDVPDTPAITSHNLQMQLDKLYGEH